MSRCYLGRKETKQKEFAKYVFWEMKVAGITQETMADALNISRQTFASRVRNGTLTFKELLTVFEILGTDADQISKLLRSSKQ